MEEKLLRYCEKAIEYGFYALVFFVPLVVTPFTFELFEFPKMILVYFLTILIVAAFLVKGILVGKFNLRRTPLDLPILLYAISYLLSTIFSIDRYTSIFGYYTRFNGGLLSLLAYVALYYIFVWEMGPEGPKGKGGKEGKREKFVGALLFSSLLVSIYGILQHFGIDKDYWVQDVQRRVFSTLGQPNWLAAYLVMILPLSLALMTKNSKFQISNFKSISNIKRQIPKPYTLLSIVLYTAFWFTYSLSGLLGLVVAMAVFLIFVGRENLKSALFPLLMVFLAWIVISALTLTPTISGRIQRIFEVIPKVSAAETVASPSPPTGSTVKIRLAVWKGTLNLIRDHPFLGTGPETFAYAFLPYRPVELNQTAEWEFLYNKAHNEYLNLAATTGLFGLAAYLWIIGKFILWNTREFRRMKANESESANVRILHAGIFAGWVGVLVSNFFGFSVVTTSLLFWLYMALCNSYIGTRDRTS